MRDKTVSTHQKMEQWRKIDKYFPNAYNNCIRRLAEVVTMNNAALVVDDNRLMLEFMGRVLSDQGYRVTTAADGFEALDQLTAMVPDIIFVDLIMPKIQGDTLCRIIRKMPHLDNSYVVVVTAAAAEMDMSYEAIGANACIAKGAFSAMARNIEKVLEEAALENMTRPKPLPAVLGLDGLHPRQMTKELLARNRHLAAILENISDGILELFSGRVVYANAAARFLLATSVEKLVGASLVTLFAPAEQAKIARLLNIEDTTGAQPTEADTVSLGRRSVVVRKLTLPSDAGAVVVLLTDVTEKRNAEQELQTAYRQLEAKVMERTSALTAATTALNQAQKMETIGRLAAGVAHDLNNILSGLSSYPELMLMDVSRDDPLRRPLEIVKKSGERAAAIIQDMLMLARSGNVEPKPIDIERMVADYLESPSHHALTRRYPEVSVSSDLSKKPLSIRGSEIMIQKTLEYLISSAMASAAVQDAGTVVISTENRYLESPLDGYDDVVAATMWSSPSPTTALRSPMTDRNAVLSLLVPMIASAIVTPGWRWPSCGERPETTAVISMSGRLQRPATGFRCSSPPTGFGSPGEILKPA